MQPELHTLADAPAASRQVLPRLAGFARTLRDNGFAVGLNVRDGHIMHAAAARSLGFS